MYSKTMAFYPKTIIHGLTACNLLPRRAACRGCFLVKKGMMWWFCAMDVPTDAVIKTLIPFVDFKTFSRHFKTMEAFQDRT